MTEDKDATIPGESKHNPQDNLIPFNKLDTATKRKIQSKGGKVSAQKRRNRAYLLKRISDIAYTPLNPSEPLTDINDLLNGKIKDINVLDLQSITSRANLTIYDILTLELIRQSTVGHNYKALTYTFDLILKAEEMEQTVSQVLINNPEVRNIYANNPDLPECKEVIDEYEDIFRLFNPELFKDKDGGK